MIADVKGDIQALDLSNAYDEVVTDNMLMSIFREMVQAATSVFVLKKGFLKRSFLEFVNLSDANEGKYFKLAQKGEVLVLLFNDIETSSLISKYYSISNAETPERLRRVVVEVEELLVQKMRNTTLTEVVIFLHDLQGILYWHTHLTYPSG